MMRDLMKRKAFHVWRFVFKHDGFNNFAVNEQNVIGALECREIPVYWMPGLLDWKSTATTLCPLRRADNPNSA